MTTVLMLSARDAGIIQIAGEPTFSNIFYVTGTSPQNIDSMTVQDVHGPLPHVSRQHELHAHLCQCQGDVRFTTATGRRCDRFLRQDFFLVINGEYGEIFTVSKVLIYLILT